MPALSGSRTGANLRRAFASAILSSRGYDALSEQAVAAGNHGAAAWLRAMGEARDLQAEGFFDIADWFEVRAKAGRSRAGRFRRVLETLL